jgi:hypothetical protein
MAISERFFETLGMPLIAGEGFRRDDTEPVAIVSESLARLFGANSPIGQHLRVGDAEAYQRLRLWEWWATLSSAWRTRTM